MILLTKSAHLVLKAPLRMMLPLAVDVPHQYIQVCGPHGEQSIPALPRKSDDALLLHPCGRGRLDLRHHLRRGSRRSKSQGQMHMVLNTADTKAFAIEPTRCTCQIRMKRRANLLGDQGLPFFRAEDNMDQIQAQRLRHGSPDVSGLQPSTLFTPPVPGLPHPSGQKNARGEPRPGLGCYVPGPTALKPSNRKYQRPESPPISQGSKTRPHNSLGRRPR
jgi:hypothetical protein